MHWLGIIFLLTLAKSEKKFGPFTTEYEYVSNFLPENDIIHCHFRLSRLNKTEKQITATLEVYKKIVDLRIWSLVMKKTPVTGYISESKGVLRTLCDDSAPMFPIMQKNFRWALNKTDCSLDKGVYTLPRYSMDEEIRNWIGDRTFYGHYKTRMMWLEGEEKSPLCGTEIAYIINPVPEVKEEKGRKNQPYNDSVIDENNYTD